jgi:acetyl-CoA carboxylase carboxyl transferase subunit beta
MCATALEHSHERVECPACGFVTHSNSEPTAGGIVVDDQGRILLVKRAHDPYGGTWDVPGGFLEEAEDAVDALRREVREETGLEVEPVEFLGVWMDRYDGDSTAEATLNLYWTARAVSGEPQAADDVDDLRWFPRDELPPADELAFENVPLVLRTWQERAQSTGLDR